MTAPGTRPEGGRIPRPSDARLDGASPRRAGGREVRVGLFVLLGVVAFFTVLFLMTDPATFRGRYMVVTEVSDAGGLRRGDPVRMRGVNIGRVHQFALNDGGVMITLEIEGRWSIPEDSRVVLAGADFLGGRPVNVIPGRSEVSVPTSNGFLPGGVEEGVMELADTLGDEARSTMERVRELVSDSTVTSFQNAVTELEALLSNLSDATSEQRGQLSEMSQSLRRSAERVEEITGREEFDRSLARIDSTTTQLTAASESLANASSSAETILARIERGEGNLGMLSTDDELYQRLTQSLEAFEVLIRDMQENPGRYVNLSIF